MWREDIHDGAKNTRCQPVRLRRHCKPTIPPVDRPAFEREEYPRWHGLDNAAMVSDVRARIGTAIDYTAS